MGRRVWREVYIRNKEMGMGGGVQERGDETNFAEFDFHEKHNLVLSKHFRTKRK